MSRFNFFFLLLALAWKPAFAFEPFVVGDIRVEGTQITEPGTVYSYMTLKKGDNLDEARTIQTIHELYATGFYRQVSLERDGTTLVVKVAEHPVIDSIDISGIREFSVDAVKSGLKEVGFSVSRIFDRTLLEAAERDIKQQYVNRGFYSAAVDVQVKPLERNRVAVTFNVVEGEVTKIRRINIIGNKVYSEDDLISLFVLSTPGWLTWLTRNDQYSRDKLSADLETLRSYYQDRGYLEFSIDDSRISLSPNLKEIYVNLALTEGQKYTVRHIELTGRLLLPDGELRKLVTLKPGDVFSRSKLTASQKAIQDRLGNEGYAFARVDAKPTINREAKTVDFRIVVDPGQRAYVRKVSISGNYVTRDDVIRRYITQLEGMVYDASLISRSRDAIDRLGFFESVTVDSRPVPGFDDQVAIDFKVKEKLSGSVQFGIGYSSGGRLAFNIGLRYDNLFGSGQSIALSGTKFNGGSDLSFAQTFPYVNAQGMNFNYQLYRRRYGRYSDYHLYDESAIGAGFGFSFPFSEDDRLNFGLNVERLHIGVESDSPPIYQDHVDIFGNTITYLTANAGWSRDRRDSLFYPMTGQYQNLNMEYTVPINSLRFLRLNYQFQQYVPVSLRSTVLFNTQLNYGKGLNGRPLPFFKNYYAGGPDTIRGLEYNGVGPVASNGDHIGGARRWLANVEYLFPFPGSGRDRTLRLSFFTDAGQVWTGKNDQSLKDFSGSYGLGLNWASPVGPFRISYGIPWRTQPNDGVQRFQFTFGTVF